MIVVLREEDLHSPRGVTWCGTAGTSPYVRVLSPRIRTPAAATEVPFLELARFARSSPPSSARRESSQWRGQAPGSALEDLIESRL